MNSEFWKNATPEQINFWRIANSKIAWNTIEPVFYQGTVVGAEFLTYAATKLYIALEIEFSLNVVVPGPAGGIVNFYDEANALFFYLMNNAIALTVADAAKYEMNNAKAQNLYFGRIVPVIYTHMRFNGYKLTIV